jgi:hypothetical protein
MADLEQIEKALPNLLRRAKIASNKDDAKLAEILTQIKEVLLSGKIAHNIKDKLSKESLKLVKPYNLLTLKPFIYAINVGQDDIPNSHQIADEYMLKLESPVAIVSAKLESEMMEMETEEKQEFIAELLDIDKVTHIPTLDDLIALAYNKV